MHVVTGTAPTQRCTQQEQTTAHHPVHHAVHHAVHPADARSSRYYYFLLLELLTPSSLFLKREKAIVRDDAGGILEDVFFAGIIECELAAATCYEDACRGRRARGHATVGV